MIDDDLLRQFCRLSVPTEKQKFSSVLMVLNSVLLGCNTSPTPRQTRVNSIPASHDAVCTVAAPEEFERHPHRP
ncbi:MAG: hypothetical protein AB7F74_11325 [Parvibaculaceae bacterium]